MVDQVTSREMQLWAENTESLYKTRLGIVKGMRKALDKGQFNKDQAMKALRRLTNLTIKDYKNNFGDFSVNSETRADITNYLYDVAMEEMLEV